MNQRSDNPFESIESAHDFVSLLAEALAETRRDIDADVQRESSSTPSRRLEAMRIASYHLQNLELHMIRSRRILNDLRSLRRLLFQERAFGPAVAEQNTVVEQNGVPVDEAGGNVAPPSPLPPVGTPNPPEASHLESRRVRAIAA